MTNLSQSKDIFGYVLKEFYEKSKKVSYLIRRDDGLVSNFEDVTTYFTKYDDWSEEEQKAMNYTRGYFLDAGAGAGRVALYLQDKGLEGIALDLSELALKVCEARGVKKTIKKSICEITANQLGAKIETIILFGNNFGVCGGEEKTIQMLKNFHKITTDNARIIASSRNATKTDNPVHLKYHQKNREEGKPPGLVRIRLELDEIIGEWWDLLMVSPEEMKELASQTGWKIVDVLGPIKNYIAILEKADSMKKS
ncbi:MAG: class I SAM-dependent methyltransferase [Candidatus Kariarchaeaceae archaeon]